MYTTVGINLALEHSAFGNDPAPVEGLLHFLSKVTLALLVSDHSLKNLK